MALLDGPGFEVRWPELFGVPYQVEDGDDADPDWMRDVVDQADRFLVKHASTLSGYSAGVLKVLVTRGREYLARRGAIAPNPVATAAVANEDVVGAFLLDDELAPDAEDGQANRPFAAAGAGTDHPGLTGNAADPDTDPNLLDIWEDADAWWWPEAVERLKQRALAFLAGDYYGQPGVVEEGRDRLEGFDNLMLDLGRVIDESLADPDVRDGTLEMLVDAYLDGATLAYWDAGPDGKGSKASARGRAGAQEFINRLVTNAKTPDRDVWGQFMSAKAKEMSDRLAAGWRVQAGAVSQGIANVVTRGIAAGKSADEISAEILGFSAAVPRARADTIARTEVTRAAAEGQLDAYGRLGVSEISVDRAFELRTQGKNSCPECVALEKLGPMPVEKARGLIPVHPQCKCRWRVVLVPAAVTNELVDAALNIFCPTGRGGGIDPTCKAGADKGVGPGAGGTPGTWENGRSRDFSVYGTTVEVLKNPSKLQLLNLVKGSDDNMAKGIMVDGAVYVFSGKENGKDIYHEDVYQSMTGKPELPGEHRFVVTGSPKGPVVHSYSVRHPVVKQWGDSLGIVVNVANADLDAALNIFCPTGKGGGIDPTCGKGGVTRAQSAAAYKASRAILDHAGRQPLTSHQALALTKQMGKLTTAQLRQLKADYGVRSGGGTKAEMATRLRGKILSKLDEARDTGPKPQPPKPAPKTEPAKKTGSTPPPQPSKAKLPHPELDPDRPGIMAGGPRRDAYGLSHEQAKALKDNPDLMRGDWVPADRLKASGVPQDRLDHLYGNKDLQRQEAGGQVFYRLSIAGRGTVDRAYAVSSPGPQEVRGPRTRKELDNLVDRFAGMSDVDRLRVQKHLGMGDGRALGAGEFKAIVETRVASNLNPVPIGERLKNSPHAEVTRKIAELADGVEKVQARRNELSKREAELSAEYAKTVKEIGKLDTKAYSSKDPAEKKRLLDQADQLQANISRIQKEARAVRNERQAINPEAEATRAAHELIHQALNKPNSYKIDETALPPPVGLPNTNLQTPAKAVSDARAFMDGKVTPRPGDPPMEPVAVVRVGPPGTRAVYYGDSKAIHMDHFTSPSVVAHEYGHHVEYRTPGSREAAQEFLKYRVGNEEAKYYKDVCPTCGYGADEKGAKDQFDKAFDSQSAYYVGKHYDHGATEIVSMGVQKMVEDPVKFAKNDPEYFNFVMGVLSGEHRNNTLPEG